MKKNCLDLIVVSLVTIIALALALFGAPLAPLRMIFGIALFLALPGYALSLALHALRPHGFVDRLLISLGLSLALCILGGMVLNLTPFGLRTSSWALLLSGVTLAACFIAYWLRRGQGVTVVLPRVIHGFSSLQALMLGLALVIMTGAVIFSSANASVGSGPGFTQLWILPEHAAGQTPAVQIGVTNMEVASTSYNVVMAVDGVEVDEWQLLNLKPKESWQTTASLANAEVGVANEVQVTLYRLDAPQTPYRHVLLWVSKAPATTTGATPAAGAVVAPPVMSTRKMQSTY